MKKILFIAGSVPPMECGVGYYTASLLAHLDDNQNHLAVLTAADSAQFDDLYEVSKAKGWRLRDLPSLLRACKQAQADIIHIQYPAVGYGRQLGINLLPWLLRIFARKPRLVVSLHEYFGSRLLGRIRDLITVMPAHKIIVSNQADHHTLPSWLKRKLTVVPLGPNIESGSPEVKTAEKLLANPMHLQTILFFGFAFPSKRLEILIAAMEHIKDKQLVVAADLGDDAYHQSLRSQIKAHNGAVGFEQIRVIGFQPSDVLVSIIQQSLCFVLPQNTPVNTKSSTVVAALTNQLPVIGKKGRDWENSPLADGENALLLETMTAELISDTVNRLAQDRSLYKHLKQQSTELASHLSWQNVAQLHYRLYDSMETKP